MTNFAFGSAGGGNRYPKARGLAEGTVVRIAEIGVVTSQFEQEIQSGPRKGQKQKRLQLRVTYEALNPGTTIPYSYKVNGATKDVAAQAYKTGDKFVQHFGGVYPKDGGGDDYTFTEEGSAYDFIQSLAKLGFAPTGSLDDYVDTLVKITQVPVRAPGQGGPSSQAFPSAIVEPGAVATTNTTAPAVVAVPAAPVAPVSKSAVAANAFEALPDAHKAILVDALKTGPVSPADIVEAGIAGNTVDAEAILAAAPKRNPLRKA